MIPLGNVISGNNGNGIEVRDTASGFTSFNTFAGVYAFGGAAPNKRDGILITSSGGNNLIRTCIVSGNLGNGIELGGNATGVQVTDTAVGTNTDIQTGHSEWRQWHPDLPAMPTTTPSAVFSLRSNRR